MGFHHLQRLQVRSKKNALLMIYRLWSGFTKNIRYILTQKGASSCRIPKFGTLIKLLDKESGDGQVIFEFIPSPELGIHVTMDDQQQHGEFNVRES